MWCTKCKYGGVNVRGFDKLQACPHCGNIGEGQGTCWYTSKNPLEVAMQARAKRNKELARQLAKQEESGDTKVVKDESGKVLAKKPQSEDLSFLSTRKGAAFVRQEVA